MSLSFYQNSVYLMIFNATMIKRSIGKTFKKKNNKKKLNDFTRQIFKEIGKLIQLIDNGTLKEKDLLVSIEQISKKFKIFYGQAQKPILPYSK